MEKLIFNSQFRPLPVNENDELFPNGIFVFDISQLIVFIKANPSKFAIEKIAVRSLWNITSKNLNESTIQTADLSMPLIFAEISPGIFNVIDGHHRLEKAYRYNIDKIPVCRVYAKQHLAFLTSVRAYNAYIEYWNGKVDQRNAELRWL